MFCFHYRHVAQHSARTLSSSLLQNYSSAAVQCAMNEMLGKCAILCLLRLKSVCLCKVGTRLARKKCLVCCKIAACCMLHFCVVL